MKKNPLILHIESATERCSVALSVGTTLLFLVENDKPSDHAASLTLMIEQIMKNHDAQLSDLDAVSLSRGPGSYTSLRIGASTAKGICFALNIPLIAVDTLRSIAYATAQKHLNPDAIYCAMIDARRMEVYSGLYNVKNDILKNAKSKVIDDQSFSDFFEEKKIIIFSGNGAPKLRETLTSPYAVFKDEHCSAAHLVTLAAQQFDNQAFENIAYFTPEYLKEPNITQAKKIF